MGDQLKVLSETTPSLLQGSLEVSGREGNREVGANPALPVHSEGRGIVAHRRRVQGPPAAGQFTRLDGVVADWGEPIAAWLPGQQNAASLHVFLLHHGLARGLRAVWEAGQGRTQVRRDSLSGGGSGVAVPSPGQGEGVMNWTQMPPLYLTSTFVSLVWLLPAVNTESSGETCPQLPEPWVPGESRLS